MLISHVSKYQIVGSVCRIRFFAQYQTLALNVHIYKKNNFIMLNAIDKYLSIRTMNVLAMNIKECVHAIKTI